MVLLYVVRLPCVFTWKSIIFYLQFHRNLRNIAPDSTVSPYISFFCCIWYVHGTYNRCIWIESHDFHRRGRNEWDSQRLAWCKTLKSGDLLVCTFIMQMNGYEAQLHVIPMYSSDSCLFLIDNECAIVHILEKAKTIPLFWREYPYSYSPTDNNTSVWWIHHMNNNSRSEFR